PPPGAGGTPPGPPGINTGQENASGGKAPGLPGVAANVPPGSPPEIAPPNQPPLPPGSPEINKNAAASAPPIIPQ
ncbi:hypothetical protein LCGC14_1877220, partial [marine sediment metagenome]